MSQEVSRHGVIIASTDDLLPERNAVFEAIVQWNQEHWEDGVIFIPLTRDTGTVADSRTEHSGNAVSLQLFDKASALIGIFRHRVASGDTRQMISQALARDGFPTALLFSSEPVPMDLIDEARELRAWRQEAPGLALDFEDVAKLKSRVRSQLNRWSAGQRPKADGGMALTVETLAPEDYVQWLRQANPGAKACTLLLYNVELETFSDTDAFLRSWAQLAEFPFVGQVALILPGFKFRRLKDYCATWHQSPEVTALLDRFIVCPLAPGRHPGASRASTSTAFCLLREGVNPNSGPPMPDARLFILSEPFSNPRGRIRPPEVVWRYRYSFLTDRDELLQSLIGIWDDAYDPEATTPLTEIRQAATPAMPADLAMDPEHSPRGDGDILLKIRLLRERLFDPNVPSYLLDAEFFMLDWNPAFEMVFPTWEFYRRENVQEFVKQLDNCAEIFQRGKSFIENKIGYFDSELLRYRSPKYGAMEFNKLASRVDDPVTRKNIGWIVALNVNHVENPERYHADLQTINEIHSLYSVYARPYRNILGNFGPYLDLVHRHVAALTDCQSVLDAGCGPALLTLELLRTGKRVTAVDCNDRMLDIARETLSQLTAEQRKQLSLIKANVETLHKPNATYLKSKIGIFAGYDGFAMLNTYHSLSNPGATLKRIRRDLLRDGAILAMSIPSPDNDLEELFEEIQRTQRDINRSEWNILTSVNLEMAAKGRLTKNSEHFEEDLQQAGFELARPVETCFAGQGLFVVARAV